MSRADSRSHAQTLPSLEETPRSSWRWLPRSTVTWVVLLDVVVIATFAFLSDNFLFIQVPNLQNMALNACALTLLACGTAFLLGSGQFDVSLGANLVLSSIVGAKIIAAVTGSSSPAFDGSHDNVPLAITLGALGALATGTLVGVINGLVVEKLRVNALVATLGMLGIASGVAFLVANGTDIGNLPPSMQENFGIATWLFIPAPVFVVAVIVAILWFTLNKTRFGLHTLAIGSMRSAAMRAGIAVGRHQVALFALVGLMAGAAGMLDLVRFNTTNVGGHQADALAAIAAAVIGGASLRGGRASIGGAIAGVVLAVALQNGLVVIGLSAFYQLIAMGVVLIIAVAIDERRRSSR